jgi:hypothetical protein
VDNPLFYVLNFLCSGICAAAWLTLFIILSYQYNKIYKEKSSLLLKDWAAESGYTVLDQTWRGFGPLWLKGGNQHVYYVSIEDREGRRRQGWVFCGGWLFGMRSGQVKVVWDEPRREHRTPPTPTQTLPEDGPLWDREQDG